jgi:hypothetical protein
VPSGRGTVCPIRGNAPLLHPPCRSPEQSVPCEKLGFVPVASFGYNCAAARIHGVSVADFTPTFMSNVTMEKH